MAEDHKEIERIWILREPPPEGLSKYEIPHLVSYLFSEKVGEMRVVKRWDADGVPGKIAFSLTVKSRGDMIRDEWEDDDLPEWAYEIVESQAQCGVHKTRSFIPYQDYTLEVDIYDHRFVQHDGNRENLEDISGMIRLECEFSSEEVANAFELPDWAAEAVEVTRDSRFKNSILAQNGWPENNYTIPEKVERIGK